MPELPSLSWPPSYGGTTGVSATFAPDVSPVAIGAAAMGFGGLLQAAIAITPIRRSLGTFRQQWHLLLLGAVAVAVYPLAFYGSMRLAGGDYRHRSIDRNGTGFIGNY
ncbi:Uncharacterised protein [Morganella morganii]|nr:Uncharacterised protein [Morganella morganii]